METLSQAEFLAALFTAATAGVGMLVVMSRAHALISAEMAERVAQSIAALKEASPTRSLQLRRCGVQDASALRRLEDA